MIGDSYSSSIQGNAWMNTPGWSKPADHSVTATLFKRLAQRTNLFKSKYDHNGIADRIKRVIGRVFATLMLTVSVSLDMIRAIIPPFGHHSLESLIALPIIATGMICGYLPRFMTWKSPKDCDKAMKDLIRCTAADKGAEIAKTVMGHHPNQKDIKALLEVAVESGLHGAVDVFIKEGNIDPNEKLSGKLSLIVAASSLHAETVRVLIQHGADPNVQEPRSMKGVWVGQTNPLMSVLLGIYEVNAERNQKLSHRYDASIASTPEETAKQLVLGEALFDNQQIKELSEGVRAFTNVNLFKVWFASNHHNPFHAYMSNALREFKNHPFLDIHSDRWLRAYVASHTEGHQFIDRFERIRETIIETKDKMIENRQDAIIDAVRGFPEVGIPRLISEYCYS